MSGLKEKAKTLSDLFWENELEWNKWLRLGLTEQKQIELAPKYQEKWVRLEDAEQTLAELKQKLRKFPCYKCVFFSKKDCQSQITCSYQMFLSWFKNEKIDELLKEEKEG
jgi:hypothetical protein